MLHLHTLPKVTKKKEKQIGLWIGLGGLIANNKF
jgi:hypothetical protein